jgi:hypothetical protein
VYSRGALIGTALIRPVSIAASIEAAVDHVPHEGNGTMHFAHAIAAGGFAARLTERRFIASDAEVRQAEQRVIARRAAAASGAVPVAASGAAHARREYQERGRHAAPRPARA